MQSVDGRSVAEVSAVMRLGRLCSFVLAALASLALTVTHYVESFHSARVALVIAVLIMFHLMRFQRVFVSREVLLYLLFCFYMLIQLLWTPDLRLAMNTLVPAASCLMAMVLFGSLVIYHDVRVVLGGILSGFILGVTAYSLTAGFPFTYPTEFSYNAIASMYLFGLVAALLFGCYSRSRVWIVVAAFVILMHIVATTSIKNNLGILLGVVGGGLIYRKETAAILRKHAAALVTFAGLLVYILSTNPLLMDVLRRGSDRIIVGLRVLQARENVPGYGSMAHRSEWQAAGLEGWVQNPVFGHGPEAFRSVFGITSHSTPVDILYNSGLIGLVLFYLVFASVALRLFSAKHHDRGNLFLLLLAVLICYFFISLSGALHYSSTFAAFLAISAGLLRQRSRRV